MADRETIIAAQNAWRDAVNAHNDEAAKYVAVWWGTSPSPSRSRGPAKHWPS
jgi:hypothetical protein